MKKIKSNNPTPPGVVKKGKVRSGPRLVRGKQRIKQTVVTH